VVGRKVGYANKAVWRALKLQTLAWADMYDDTVVRAPGNLASISAARYAAPKVEPEIVVTLRRPVPPGLVDPADVLSAAASLALGFEVIDCVYQDWAVTPADFVAAYGLHAALLVGEPVPVEEDAIPRLADALAACTVTLSRDGQVVQEGAGRNALRSPALCVAELASALARRSGSTPLGAGELISTGTLTDSCRIAPGETWTATVHGLDLPPLTLAVTA
jgi:2-oxo-3-hexenedioate decarboxylase